MEESIIINELEPESYKAMYGIELQFQHIL